MNNEIAAARLARVPSTIRESLLDARSDLRPGAIASVARFFDVLAARGEHPSAPTRGAFEQACPNESALGLLLRVLSAHGQDVCLAPARELRKDLYRRRPGGSASPDREKPRRGASTTQPRNWPQEWLDLLPSLQNAPLAQSTIDRHVASINRCADLVCKLPFRPRLGWLLAWELGRILHEGTEGSSTVNARTVAVYLGGLVALGLHGGLAKDALDGLRSVQRHFGRRGSRLPKTKEGRLNALYDAGGYEEILRTIVAKLEQADRLPDWSAEAAEARATAAILAVCVNIPARTGDVAHWRLGHELNRTVWGTWELRWKQEKTGGWITLNELWPEVAKVLDEHILGGRPARLAQARFGELEGRNWLTFGDESYASRWPSERVKDAIGVPLHDLRTLCADYLRLHDPVSAPRIVATMLGHSSAAAGNHYTALCVDTAAQQDWMKIREGHLDQNAGKPKSKNKRVAA